MTRVDSTPVPGAGSVEVWSGNIPASAVADDGAYAFVANDGYVTTWLPGTSYWGAYVPIDGTSLAEIDIASGSGPSSVGTTLTIGRLAMFPFFVT
jgi:hypothetical protein